MAGGVESRHASRGSCGTDAYVPENTASRSSALPRHLQERRLIVDTDKTARDYLENWRTDLEKMQAMQDRIAELEHYNLGLATEVHGLEYALADARGIVREQQSRLEFLYDGTEGSTPAIVTICRLQDELDDRDQRIAEVESQLAELKSHPPTSAAPEYKTYHDCPHNYAGGGDAIWAAGWNACLDALPRHLTGESDEAENEFD